MKDKPIEFKLSKKQEEAIKQIPIVKEKKVIWVAFPERYVHAEILIFPSGEKLVDFSQTPEQRGVLFSLKALRKIVSIAQRGHK